MILAVASGDPTITSPAVWGPLGAFFIFGVYMIRNMIEGYKADLKEEREWNKQIQSDMINKVVPAITSSTEATTKATESTAKALDQLTEWRAELQIRRQQGS